MGKSETRQAVDRFDDCSPARARCILAVMETTRLDPALAAAFVRRLGERIDYNINIMNRDGVIIASRDQSRVGSYHEAAHRLVQSGGAIETVEPSEYLPAGVKPGVNLPILYKSEVIGVVGVTGEPSVVEPVAYAVKTSVETMVELELYKDLMLRRQDSKNTLLNYLLYEDVTPRYAASALAAKLGYDVALPRAPILIHVGEGFDPAATLKAIKRNSLHSPEDLSSVTNDGAIFVFKTIRLSKQGIFAEFESQIEDYLAASRQALGGRIRLRAYVGMFQTDIARYRGAYRQAAWLASRYPEQGEPVLFAHRRLMEYFIAQIPRAELVNAFAPLTSFLLPDLAADFLPSFEALVESGFNVKEAAGSLGVHRNTLAARLDRYSSLIGADPRVDSRARDLAALFFRFLELSESK